MTGDLCLVGQTTRAVWKVQEYEYSRERSASARGREDGLDLRLGVAGSGQVRRGRLRCGMGKSHS